VLLAWAVSCDSYELHDDGTADIFLAGFDTVRVASLPLTLEISVLIKALMQEREQAELEFHLLGPDTKPIRDPVPFSLVATPTLNHRPGYTVSVVEAIDFAIPISSTGIHSIEIWTENAYRDPLSEERRRSIHVNVFRQEEPQHGILY
jgi:hypothetical protein